MAGFILLCVCVVFFPFYFVWEFGNLIIISANIAKLQIKIGNNLKPDAANPKNNLTKNIPSPLTTCLFFLQILLFNVCF